MSWKVLVGQQGGRWGMAEKFGGTGFADGGFAAISRGDTKASSKVGSRGGEVCGAERD
jgi:hypothetical protein